MLRHLSRAPFVQMLSDEDGDIFYDALEEFSSDLDAEDNGGLLAPATLKFWN